MTAVAAGIVVGMLQLGAQPRCLVGPGRGAEWAELLPLARIDEVGVRLDSGSRWQSTLRRALPARLKTSRAVEVVRHVRSRAVRAASQDDVVWYPFHRSLATASASVVTVHDLRVFEPDFASAMDQRIIAHNVAHARAIVCSWPHPFESLLSRFPEARGKTFRVPLPVLNAGQPQLHRAAPSSGVSLLYPAYVTRHKDHETVIRSLRLLPDARLVCTGAETDYAAQMRSLAKELRVASRIEWRGYVDRTELDAAYKEADILVMPSLWEAASGPVLEAVARGVPFVASDIPPLAAQVRALGLPAEDWLFAARDPESLATAISRTVGAYGDRMAALAQPSEAVLARTWEATARDYLRVCSWAAGQATIPSDLMDSQR